MEKDARYAIVGLFVSIALVGLVWFTVWVVGGPTAQDRDLYTVYFTDPVSGLVEGASVQYRGVEVGKVLDVRLDEQREDLIKVDIAVDEETPVGKSTTATLEMLGVTGLVYIDLTTDTGERQPPERIPGEKHPVLEGSGTQLAKIFQDIPLITRQIRDLGEKLNNFFDEENTRLLAQSLENAERLSRDLNGLLTPENISNASITLENLSVASADAKNIAERFERTADELEQAIRSLNDMIAGNQENINRFTSEGLGQITETAREAEKTVEALREITERLNRDPSQIIYKPQTRGVEIPR